ncbi:MAG: hypothetical protein LBS36_09115 [Oscillospiraceae bacterium]|nr:hypothetical protein [Oscillospiraceae bacterium]
MFVVDCEDFERKESAAYAFASEQEPRRSSGKNHHWIFPTRFAFSYVALMVVAVLLMIAGQDLAGFFDGGVLSGLLYGLSEDMMFPAIILVSYFYLHRRIERCAAQGENKRMLLSLLFVFPYSFCFVGFVSSVIEGALLLLRAEEWSDASINHVPVYDLVNGLLSLLVFVCAILFLFFIYIRLMGKKIKQVPEKPPLRLYIVSVVMITVLNVLVGIALEWLREKNLPENMAVLDVTTALRGLFFAVAGLTPIVILYFGGKKAARQTGGAVGPFPLILPLFSYSWATVVWGVYQTMLRFFFKNTVLDGVYEVLTDPPASAVIEGALTIAFAFVCVRLYRKLTAGATVSESVQMTREQATV